MAPAGGSVDRYIALALSMNDYINPSHPKTCSYLSLLVHFRYIIAWPVGELNKPAQAPLVRNIPFKLAEMISKIAYFELDERGYYSKRQKKVVTAARDRH
jgi:hypothetical protein